MALPLPPIPKADPTTNAVDLAPLQDWIKKAMVNWPLEQAMINRFLAIKGSSLLTQDEATAVAGYVKELADIYASSQGTMTPEQMGTWIVDAIFNTADVLKDILGRVAPQLVQYIPLLLLGTGV